MDDKKKKYVIPEAELIRLSQEDIVAASDAGVLGLVGEDPDGEDF